MKTTLATIKKFIRTNETFIKQESSFDGMIDCVSNVEDDFRLVHDSDFTNQHTLGIQGLWLVGESRDYFREYDDGKYIGYEIFNCCGSCVIAKAKQPIDLEQLAILAGCEHYAECGNYN